MEQYFTDLDGLTEQAAEIIYSNALNRNKINLSNSEKYIIEQTPKILRKYDINFLDGLHLVEDVLDMVATSMRIEDKNKSKTGTEPDNIGDETVC